MNSKKVALIILDGWGFGASDHSDAVHLAKTPFIDSLQEKYAHASLLTDGLNVGLPEGQMGNSEVGHLNIGAGRVVYQDLAKINLAVENNSISENSTLIDALNYAKNKDVNVHFIGLVSDGGIHSHQNHLYKLCEIATAKGLENVFVHAFTDGRDTDPKSGKGFIEQLENRLENQSATLVSAIGRYYAMDRDNRWERIKLAYDLLCKGEGEKVNNLSDAFEKSYNEGVTDEFLRPMIKNDFSDKTIKEGDVVICFNFRTDRCREITTALSQRDFAEQQMKALDLYYVTMTNYDKTFEKVHIMFDKENLSNTLGEVLASHNKTQVRIAETEKYPHVSFFFSGGREETFEGEKRIMIPSPKVATYDMQPSMSAKEVTEAICNDINENTPDFICLNFANPDMVGHTGVIEAVKEAVETVDTCASEVVRCGQEHNYSFIIIADHGNAEFMINPDGTPNTAHTTNPVPIYLLDEDISTINSGKLADVAPTVLALMGVPQAAEMTGKSLL